MTVILNLGCGTKTSALAINIDWSIYQRMRVSRTRRVVARLVLNGDRLDRFAAMDGDIVIHDLRKGIPAEDNSADAVYHSHTLEHIDRPAVPGFMAEILRVLKPGGIHRVVVPDLERVVREYLADFDANGEAHDRFIDPILGQSVRREASGTSTQRPARRFVENLLMGDARRRGETHQWMYDELNLRQILLASGFDDVTRLDAYSSAIEGWAGTGLDVLPDGSPYIPGSLWMEARKP